MAIIDATRRSDPSGDGLGNGSVYATALGNHPLIGHICRELHACGVRRARVVTRTHTRRELARSLGGGEAFGLDIGYVDAPADNGRRAVLTEVEHALKDGAVLVHPGDCLLRNELSRMTRSYQRSPVDCVLAADPVPATIAGDPARTIGLPAIVGRGAESVLSEMLRADDDHGTLDSALSAADLRTTQCTPADVWRYSATTESLLAGNRMVLDALVVNPHPGDLDGSNQLHGRVSVARSAALTNCVVFGPVAIGDHAVLEDSYIGPYTAIARGAVVVGAEVDNSMVLAGAELRHPGSRIVSSIIGVGAQVTQSFALPRGMQLRLGAGSRLSTS